MNDFFRPISNIENNNNIHYSSLGKISSRLLDFGQCRSIVVKTSKSENLKGIHLCREEIRDEKNGNKISLTEKTFKILVTGAILTGAVTFSALLLLIPTTIMAVKAFFHFSNTFISIDNLLSEWIKNSDSKGAKIEAASRIKAAFNHNYKELDLKSLLLTELPSCIGLLSNLIHLDLSNNRFDSLCPEIGLLSNLVSLDLSNNKLITLPKEIFQLSNLTKLNLFNNVNMEEFQIRLSQISTSLNEWIKNSEAKGDKSEAASRIKEGFNNNSKGLDLSGFDLTELPSCIGLLSKLTHLGLSRNNLESVSPNIGMLPNLISLDLSNNKLITLPKEIFQLSNLTKLNLFDNVNMEEFQIRLSQISTSLNVWIKNSEAKGDKIEAASRIKEAFNNNSKGLDLSGFDLTELPSCIGQLTGLTCLYLFNNKLVTLPKEIGLLVNLKILNLSTNKLITLPPEIGSLSNLLDLYLINNKLITLPPEICQLCKLDTLNLSKNKLTTLPLKIDQLSKLTFLDLSNNKLISLPSIGQLPRLTWLYLSNNELITMSSEKGQLPNLTLLDLSNNKFIALPLEKGSLINLLDLYLSNNALIALPSEIGQLSKLACLDVSNNVNLKEIPISLSQISTLTRLRISGTKITKRSGDLTLQSSKRLRDEICIRFCNHV